MSGSNSVSGRRANVRYKFIRAAGGVVWRSDPRDEVAVIYRDLHEAGECCLPKGKLEPGESWEAAARREVREETGCDAVIERFADAVTYYVGRRPKVVVFFQMRLAAEGRFEPSPEVRATEWLPVAEALAALTHDAERDLLLKSMQDLGLPGVSPTTT